MALESIVDKVRTLYVELERLSVLHEELMDTDVRESLHMSLNYFFVWGNTLDKLPISYGMFSLEGDRSIARAVDNFLLSVASTPELRKVSLGRDRLDLLQNPNIITPEGCQYDDFIGHTGELLSPEVLPEDLFEEGDYDD